MKHLFTFSLFLVSFVVRAQTFTLMQYNVQNLFDTKFDRGTNDYSFLPLAVKKTLQGHKEICDKLEREREECLTLDWTDAKLAKKIQNISRVVKAFDASGRGPDVVVMQEVENLNVLNLLNRASLSSLGYKYAVLIEGDDNRGIDIGIISKFPVLSSKHYSIIMNGQRLDTRGILEVTLNVNNKTVVIYGNHWPSQSNPVEHRVASAQLLERIASAKTADLIIAAGDFNTLPSERPMPFESLKSFTDLETLARKQGVRIHPGTRFTRGQWTSLDHVFLHSKSTLKPDLSTFSIFHHDFMMVRDPKGSEKIPYRYNHNSGEGFSDHLPVGVSFKY